MTIDLPKKMNDFSILLTLESDGLVENLSLFSPFASKRKTTLSAVATANF